jgi:hypothetical protein
VKTPPSPHWKHRVAFGVACTVVLFVLVLMPFAVGSAVGDLLGPPEGRNYPLATPAASAPGDGARLHVAVVGLSELQQTATLRVSGYHVCAARCDWTDRVIFVAERDEAVGTAPSASVDVPASGQYINQTVELPVRGHSTRYPFDAYHARLGVVLQRVAPDGSVRTIPRAEAAGQLTLTLQEEIPRMIMESPSLLDPSVALRADPRRDTYVVLADLTVDRPLYLRILTVLLVVLVAAASAYAVFMRPLHDLVVNAGALVIGVWGVRSMLVPMPWTWLTSIDLSLSIVIIFLLGAITIRAVFFFLWERAGLRLPFGKPPAPNPEGREQP